MNPKARQDSLVVEQIWDEFVVYDKADNRVHRLNASAATVWRHCDGSRTLTELAAVLHDQLGLPADESVARVALDELGRAGLLVGPPPIHAEAISRRQMLDRLKVAAYLLPVVASIVAPVPLAAASNTGSPTSPSPTSFPTPTPPPTTTPPSTSGPPIVPQAGVYGPGQSTLQSQTCNPSFFGSGFTEVCTIGPGLTSCTISDPGGAPRVSTGSVVGLVGTFTGSGLIGSAPGTWTTTCQWTSNQTLTTRETLHLTTQNCDGTFVSAALTRQ